MDVYYPIFIKDKDGWMRILNTFEEIQVELEKIDILDKEYIIWDSKSLPLEFYLEREKIKIKILSETPQVERLKDSILNYAKLGRPKVSFAYSGPEDNIVELFKAVEEHIRAGSFIYKLKSFFKTKA